LGFVLGNDGFGADFLTALGCAASWLVGSFVAVSVLHDIPEDDHGGSL